MVSRRKLFSIMLMMTVLFSLFMLTQIYREVSNDYDTNEYAEEMTICQADTYKMQEEAEPSASGKQTVFIGDRESRVGHVLAQWCFYTKRSFKCFSALSDYAADKSVSADVLCFDPDFLSAAADLPLLDKMTDQGMIMIFTSLPETETIKKSSELRRLLGIERIVEEDTSLNGIILYKGFLLGGEAVYQADTKEEEQRQDLELTVPWYKLGNRSKTYMAGLVKEKNMRDADDPAIVWRNSVENTKIFAVNGEYLCEETGLGFLDAMMAESHSYTIYPVVNAQNLLIGDYPCLSSENDGVIRQIYSSSQKQLQQNVIWPGFISLSDQSGFRLTCFLTPQNTYMQKHAADVQLLNFYLRQIKERRGEAGWYALSREGISVRDKKASDGEFFKEAGSRYIYTSVLGSEENRKELLMLPEDDFTAGIRTMTGDLGKKDFLLSFISDEITYQGITHYADKYNYSDDLRNRSIQTALGYTNILLDMECVLWPEDQESQWERYSKKVLGNIGTCWNRFSAFEKTTITESDSRLRKFLALDYEDAQKKDAVELKIDNRQGTADFLLRTHDKEIDKVLGGTFSEIEQDAYLVHAQEDRVLIYLKNRDGKKVYD